MVISSPVKIVHVPNNKRAPKRYNVKSSGVIEIVTRWLLGSKQDMMVLAIQSDLCVYCLLHFVMVSHASIIIRPIAYDL